jgi:hypothetical protein
MIEALNVLPRKVAAAQVAAVRLDTNPRWLKVCDIKQPRTGLEVKFSYAWLAGMVFEGIPTGDDRTYVDALAEDARLVDFARKVIVTGKPAVTDMQALGEVELIDGSVLPFFHDLAAPLPHETLERGLRAKAAALLGAAEADRLWGAVAGLDSLSAAELATMLEAAK